MVIYFCVRFAASHLSPCSRYHAVNERIYGFEPGTEQRLALDAKLKEYNSKVFDVPIVIGDQEIRTKTVRYQVKVCCKIIIYVTWLLFVIASKNLLDNFYFMKNEKLCIWNKITRIYVI